MIQKNYISGLKPSDAALQVFGGIIGAFIWHDSFSFCLVLTLIVCHQWVVPTIVLSHTLY